MRGPRSETIDRLYQAVLLLESREECAAFFEDLCTVRELQDMAKRLHAAQLLDGGMSYMDTSSRAGISTATVSRVNKSVHYGSGGYRTILDRLQAAEERE